MAAVCKSIRCDCPEWRVDDNFKTDTSRFLNQASRSSRALICTAIMAFVLVALSTLSANIFTTGWRSGGGWQSRFQGDEDLALALDRLTADIEAAEYVSANQGLDPYFEGTSNSIVFVRTTLSPNARPSLEFVRFAEVRSANGPVLVRTEAPFRIFRNNSINSGKSRFENPVVLVRGSAPGFRLLFERRSCLA